MLSIPIGWPTTILLRTHQGTTKTSMPATSAASGRHDRRQPWPRAIASAAAGTKTIGAERTSAASPKSSPAASAGPVAGRPATRASSASAGTNSTRNGASEAITAEKVSASRLTAKASPATSPAPRPKRLRPSQ